MRPALVVVVVVFVAVALLPGCNIFSSALPCGDDVGCAADEACVAGHCAARDGVVSEGEGDVSEGEGDVVSEGEGDVVSEGEGDVVSEGEGEGDVVSEGEGEGDVVSEGEGEGDVVSEGEGEGDVVGGEGEGEGEGEGPPPDPCPPLFENQFTRNYRPVTNPPANTTASIVNDDRIDLTAGVLGAQGHAAMGGPGGSYAGAVIEVTMNVTARPSQNSEAGFQLTALTTTGFDIRVDVFDDTLAMIALFPDGSFSVASNPIGGFETGLIQAQLRLDGPNPVATVNGVTMVLNAPSAAMTSHGLDVLAGCELAGCNGASATVTRVALYGACRP